MTFDQVEFGSQAIYIFIICLLFVYLLLSAKYESFLLPLPVILALPFGLLGTYLFLLLWGLENNIYAQVAMLMLIGVLSRNAILIVEYAIQHQKRGHSSIKAAIEGAKERLRPIFMTSFSFIAGLIPLVFATGAGAVGNSTIGVATVGGMILGTILGVLIIPGLYYLFAETHQRKNNGQKQ